MPLKAPYAPRPSARILALLIALATKLMGYVLASFLIAGLAGLTK
jgi:hypothetical protein